MGVVNSDTCTRCNLAQRDTVEHFFFECASVVPLWQEISKLASFKFGINVILDKQAVILGIQEYDGLSLSQRRQLNGLVLIGKNCISKFKYGKIHSNIVYLLETELRIRGVT